MERFVIIVNGWKPLTIITKRSIFDVAAALDPPLKWYNVIKHFRLCISKVLKYYNSNDVYKLKHSSEILNVKIRRFTSRVNFVENNKITTTSRIQIFSTGAIMNELSTNNSFRELDDTPYMGTVAYNRGKSSVTLRRLCQ